MANLGGITQYQNQISAGQSLTNGGNGAAGVQHTANASGAEASNAIHQELMQLGKGSVFTGTVIQMKDGNVTVSLDNGQQLHARLDRGVSVTLGQPVLFEVKANQNNQLMLRQVPIDSGYNPTLQKALTAAGLAVNGRNLQMVNAMMQNQLPIDKTSLLAMARQLQVFSGAAPESLVQMKKLGFPMTEAMVQQFEAYKQGEHSLVERFGQMMDQLPELLTQEEAGGRSLLELQKGLLQALEILEEPGAAKAASGQEAQASGLPGQGGLNTEGLPGQGVPNTEGLSGQESQNVSRVPGQEILITEEGFGQGGPNTEGLPGQGVPNMEGIPGQEGQNVSRVPGQEVLITEEGFGQGGGGLPLPEFMSQEHLEGLEQQLRQLPGMEQNPALFSEGRLNTAMSSEEMLRAIARQLEELLPQNSERVKALFSGKGYQSLLKQAMSEQWLLEPRQVEQEKSVEQLYQRLNRQMEKLEQLLQQAGKQDMAAARNTTQVRGNLEMMQQINQLYNYVQIPLKLRGQNAHSDLYVYTNKKSLGDKDGELSALLHLELDHLGVTDVRIKMLGSHVSTNFRMADEAALELVEAHLEELNEALNRKGYQCSFQVERGQKELDFVQDFLEHEAPIGRLQRYSFDVLT